MGSPHHTPRYSKYVSRFPNRIRRRRLALGLRQRDIAERLERRAATISSWELGLTAPRAQDAFRLARELGTMPEDLYWAYYSTAEPVPPAIPVGSRLSLTRC